MRKEHGLGAVTKGKEGGGRDKTHKRRGQQKALHANGEQKRTCRLDGWTFSPEFAFCKG